MKTLLTAIAVIIFAGLLYQPEKGIAETGKHNSFQPGAVRLQTGDVILRRGKGFISEVFRKSSRYDQHYSHAGVVEVTNQGIYVIHVIGEPGTTVSNLRKERMSDFCSSNENLEYAVYRYSFLSGKTAA